MKSSIKIDFIDRGTGKGIEPVIRIESISSEDPRDTLISTLLQSVSGSSYLQLVYAPTESYYDPKAETHNRVLLFKPEQDMGKMIELAWASFREWVKENNYETLTPRPGDSDVYYQYGNARLRQSALFTQFLDTIEIRQPKVVLE